MDEFYKSVLNGIEQRSRGPSNLIISAVKGDTMIECSKTEERDEGLEKESLSGNCKYECK